MLAPVERVAERLPVGSRPFVEVVLGGRDTIGQRDGDRRLAALEQLTGGGIALDAQPHLDLGDDQVSGLLAGFGHHQLGVVPRMRDLGVGHGRRELGLLVERPLRQVVVDPGGVWVVGVPVGHGRPVGQGHERP